METVAVARRNNPPRATNLAARRRTASMDHSPWWDSTPARVWGLAVLVALTVLLVAAAANQVNRPVVPEVAAVSAPP
jgi:hypothetical protein